MDKKRISWKDAVVLLLLMFLWALCFPLISIGLQGSSPLYFAALRSLIAGLGLVVPALALRRPLPQKARLWLSILGISLSYTVAGFAGMFLAGTRLSPGLASILTNTQPLIAAVLALLLLGERLGRKRLYCLLLGFLGVVLTTVPSFNGGQALENSLLGMSYVFLAVMGVAVGNILIKRLKQEIDLLMLAAWQFLIAAAVLFLLAQWLEAPLLVAWNARFLLTLFLLGLGGTSLPFLLWIWLMQRTELTPLNTFSFLSPIFALIISAIFFGERLQWIQITGIIITLYGVWQISQA